MFEAITSYFSDPERGIMGIICLIFGGIAVYLYIDNRKLNSTLLTKAEQYADAKSALAERVMTTIASFKEMINGNNGKDV